MSYKSRKPSRGDIGHKQLVTREGEKLKKPQVVFKQTVEEWIKTQAPDFADLSGKSVRHEAEELRSSFPFTFHDTKSVAVDSYLYDVLNYGHTEYGFGRTLSTKLNEALRKAGYYLENQGAGVFVFVRA